MRMPLPRPSVLSVERGTCYALFAYDIAMAIDLNEAERQILAAKQRERLRPRRRAPKYFEYQPPPLRVTQEIEPVALGFYRSSPTVDLVLYDFGAVSVTYGFPLRGPFSDLLALSDDLYDNELLLSDSQRRVEELILVLRQALSKPHIADFVEDYVIFQIETFASPCTAEELCAGHAQEIAQILRAEKEVLSEQEVRDALSHRISFGSDDVTIVDWNATLLFDRNGDDVRAVLEFANVELLELRYLDERLDEALDRSYEALSRGMWGPFWLLRSYGADLRRIAQWQADSAMLFEGVSNALKLLGDQYLARVYRLVSRRLHLAEWDASIIRKLQTLESIYEKMSDQAANRRMELLEWIIILLIALSIILPFLLTAPGH